MSVTKAMMRLLLAVVVVLCASCGRRADPLPGVPRVVLWAWERKEDLRFLSPRDAAVAYLARTVTIRGDHVVSRPRFQPLLLSPGTQRIAVVRIDTDGKASGDASAAATECLKAVTPGIAALQLDFDATLSERGFYRDLIAKVKPALSVPLTITALVSWCTGDPWIRNLPVADATPMYFSMGREQGLRNLKIRADVCESSTGVSTRELFPVAIHRRVYLFSPAKAWDAYRLREALKEISAW